MTAPTIIVNGELTIPLYDRTLVASTSEPNAWHVVTGAGCDCAGYHYRGTCKHIAMAYASQRCARQLAEQQAPAIVTATPSYPDIPVGEMAADQYDAWMCAAHAMGKQYPR